MNRALGLSLILSIACSSTARRGHLDSDASTELSESVKAREAEGRLDEALELALQCVAECEGFVGDFSARNSFELARKSVTRQARLWDAVTRIEDQLLACSADCDDYFFVVSHRLGIIYRAAGDPSRARRFLQRV